MNLLNDVIVGAGTMHENRSHFFSCCCCLLLLLLLLLPPPPPLLLSLRMVHRVLQ
jgi:hypothetical protein